MHTSPSSAASQVDPTHAHAEDKLADRVPQKNADDRGWVVDPPEGVVPQVYGGAQHHRQAPEEGRQLPTDRQILEHEIPKCDPNEEAGAVVVGREVPPRVWLGHAEHHWLQVPQLKVRSDVEEYMRCDAGEHTDQNGTGYGYQAVQSLSVVDDDEDGTDECQLKKRW